jgi:hypothetical protein
LVDRAVVLSGGTITHDGPVIAELHDSHIHHHPHSLEPEAARGGWGDAGGSR